MHVRIIVNFQRSRLQCFGDLCGHYKHSYRSLRSRSKRTFALMASSTGVEVDPAIADIERAPARMRVFLNIDIERHPLILQFKGSYDHWLPKILPQIPPVCLRLVRYWNLRYEMDDGPMFHRAESRPLNFQVKFRVQLPDYVRHRRSSPRRQLCCPTKRSHGEPLASHARCSRDPHCVLCCILQLPPGRQF